MKRVLYILYAIIQCTWGLGQTLIGFVLFLVNIRCPHHFYRGSIETRWNSKYAGISLGIFIFTPQSNTEKVRVHEYGHTFQSLVLGPFYLIPGIISMGWGTLPRFREKRRGGVPYTACFVEWQASKLGEIFTGEKAIW